MSDLLPKIKFFVVAAALLLASYNILRTTYDVYQSSQRLDELNSELAKTKEENEALKKEYAYKTTQEFVEEEARNKLTMVKPGERVVLVEGVYPKRSTPSAMVKPYSYNFQNENLKKWIALFFDN